MRYTLEAAMEQQTHTVERYRPKYHLSVPGGWLNDPNGFSFYRGRYQLFYQYHPYSSEWGPMHWGHWSSEDLAHWRRERVALAPDAPFDEKGCFSGTALEKDGKLYALYTGVTEGMQQQCLAVSEDGIAFAKEKSNPVIPAALLPEGFSASDFRDPKLMRCGDGYRAVVAAQRHGVGKLVSFLSDDLLHWRYEGVFWESAAAMCECPDVFALDGCDAVITCLMRQTQTVTLLTGRVEAGRFEAHGPGQPLDEGLDYYAPQTMRTPDGRRVLIGWAQSWAHVSPTHWLGHGWSGTMTVPRELTLKDGCVKQKPARELTMLRRNVERSANVPVRGKLTLPQCEGPCKEWLMKVELTKTERFALRVMQTGSEYFEIAYEQGVLTVSREQCGYPFTPDGQKEKCPSAGAQVPLEDGCLELHVLVDVSIVEVYAQGGKHVFTSLACPKGEAYGVQALAQGEAHILTLQSWDLLPSES